MNHTTIQKFWSKVDIRSGDECWEWKAGVMDSGYGNFSPETGKQESSHRMSWIIKNGSIPKGLWVLHKCDNRLCVNPAHLFLGTYRDNIDDMVNKGRTAKGERCPRAKLTVEDVQEIKKLLNIPNLSQREIALKFHVSRQSISYIKNELTWKGIE